MIKQEITYYPGTRKEASFKELFGDEVIRYEEYHYNGELKYKLAPSEYNGDSHNEWHESKYNKWGKQTHWCNRNGDWMIRVYDEEGKNIAYIDSRGYEVLFRWFESGKYTTTQSNYLNFNDTLTMCAPVV